MQASDAHPKASDGHPKASDGRTKAANGQFISTAKKLSQCFIENRKLPYEKRQSASRRLKTARPTSPSRFLQMTKAALSMIESAHKEDRNPLYNRPKAAKRTTESHHKDDRKPPSSNKKQAARWTPPRSTFHFLLFTLHFHKRETLHITPIQCSTYGARMAVKMPLRVRPSEA